MKQRITAWLTTSILFATPAFLLAADFLTSDFSSPGFPTQLLVPPGYVSGINAYPIGTAQNTNDSFPGRDFIATSASDYSTSDFTFEITVNVGTGAANECAFVGLGYGYGPNPSLGHLEPHTSVYFRLFPEGFLNGALGISVSRDLGNNNEAIVSAAPHPGAGTHRVQIQKAGDFVSFACDIDYTGGPFVTDYSVSYALSQELSFLNSTNSRLFFGTKSSRTSFDNLVINSGCTPHKAIATANVINGFVIGANLLGGGCGYANPPIVSISGGGGSGAAATASISNGVVTRITITSAGCCYTSIPKFEIASPPFAPKLEVAVSKVKVIQNVVLGRRYVLQVTSDFFNWSPIGSPFIAPTERITNELDVDVVGRHFRILEVP